MSLIGTDFLLEAFCLKVYDNSDKTKQLLKNVIDVYNMDVADNSLLDVPINKLYTTIIEDMLLNDIDVTNEGEITALLMRFENSPIIQEDPKLLQNITKILSNFKSDNKLRIKQLQNKLNNCVIWYHGNKHLRKMFAKSQQCAVSIDPMQQDILLNEVLEYARNIVSIYASNTGSKNTENIAEVDLSNTSSIKHAIDTFKRQKETNIMKTGLQGLNRMFGEAGGIAMGEFVGFGALPHHYKTGILVSMARYMATLNKPDPTMEGIPVILVYSLENEAHTNLMQWFKESYINAYQKHPIGLSDEEIIDYVVKTYSANGFKLIIRRKLGEYFGYEEWRSEIEELKASGHKIYSCIIDYLALMKVDPNVNRPKGLQNLAHFTKSYAKYDGFSLITGFQLDDKAAQIAISGQTYISKRFGMTHIAESKGLFREFDVVIFMHIEKNQHGIPHLTFCWNKHRDTKPPEPKDSYTCYRLGKFGILDDVNSTDRSIPDIYVSQDENTNTNVSLF